MRETPLSKCEYEFVTKCIAEGKRIDGRMLLDSREVKVSYKLDYGCCIVTMGKTKVLAQVSAEMDRPKESRSNEGNLGIFVEMSTMASPGFDPTKPGELGVELQRMLERSILLSKALDVEELCVRVSEQAWNISLHLQIVSHDGNLLDCASIASIAALSHFKRPDVSVIGKEVTVHTFEEKNPVPLTFNHQPFCTTFAFFDNGTVSVMDPTKIEEGCCDGKLMIAMNKHREVCCTQMSGVVQVSSDQVLKCTNIAAKKAKELSEFIKKSITNDEEAKKKGLKSSVTSSHSFKSDNTQSDSTTHVATTDSKIKLPPIKDTELKMEVTELRGENDDKSQKLSWIMKNSEDTYTAGEDKPEINTTDTDRKQKITREDQEMDTDGEEDTTVVLQLT